MAYPTPLLDTIHDPADTRGFDVGQLRQLADELRGETIDAVSVTGGHLGAGVQAPSGAEEAGAGDAQGDHGGPQPRRPAGCPAQQHEGPGHPGQHGSRQYQARPEA